MGEMRYCLFNIMLVDLANAIKQEEKKKARTVSNGEE
jgi:hypothetical protein